jgi:glutathione synthase/RimK-type ligase-like ATP-grasp enzyme
VEIVPTSWRERLAAGELASLFDGGRGSRIVIKPLVGANADGVFRVDREALAETAGEVETYYAERALMVQPWVDAVTTEGEYSLIYFKGDYSDAVLKMPRPGDFRVQEEHGAEIRAVTPDAALRAAGDVALAALNDVPLYARADFVRANGRGGFWLMELELVEPGLYLRMDAGAPERFARALDARLGSGTR